jgi:hypothetical protein
MYIHDRKTGLILPLPLYLLWRYKIQILIFSAAMQVIAPLMFLMVPKEHQLSRNIESPFVAFHERCIKDGRDPNVCQLNYPVK